MRAITIIAIAAFAVAIRAEEHIAVSTGQLYYDTPSVGRPFGTDAQRFQILVMETELQANKGDKITGMAFNCALASTNPATFKKVEILVCPTSKGKLDIAFEVNYAGANPQRVLSKDAMTVNWARTGSPLKATGKGPVLARGDGKWQKIAFDTPYVCNGTGNLIFEIRHAGGNGTVQTTRWRSEPGRVLDSVGGLTDKASLAQTGFLRDYLNGLRLYVERAKR
jgi:hypothetical protein